VVYFAPNTNQGFTDALVAAIEDRVNRPSIVSICWGSPESLWTVAAIRTMNETLKRAAEQGITMVVAAGDGGVTDNTNDGQPHVDFPASSPYVVAVGGTRLTQSESGDTIASEVVWNDQSFGATGGGVSALFDGPSWQAGVNVPARIDGKAGRGVPDVAANADPATGYKVYLHGQQIVLGGTSTATPLWAGLLARIYQGLGKNLGYINPLLYEKIGPQGVLRAITEGQNGIHGVKGYSAGPGWNACTGWGTPNGRKLLTALSTISR